MAKSVTITLGAGMPEMPWYYDRFGTQLRMSTYVLNANTSVRYVMSAHRLIK